MHGWRDPRSGIGAGDITPAYKRLDRVVVAGQSDRMSAVPEKRKIPRRLRRLQTAWTSRGRPLFFVTFCTAERQPWLDDSEIHRAFREFCRQSPERAEAWVGHYAVMPDHVHLFVSVEGPRSLSRWVGALKRHLAKVRRKSGQNPAGDAAPANNVEHGERQDLGSDVGHPCTGGVVSSVRAWQDGFFDHLLRSGESYAEKWNYVRMNPVRAGLVARPEDWPYSGEIEKLSW